jgi:hypothetical protein
MLEDGIEKMYEQWMFRKWCGLQSKQDTIRMIELGYNWAEFKDELLTVLDFLDDE